MEFDKIYKEGGGPNYLGLPEGHFTFLYTLSKVPNVVDSFNA